MLTEDKEKNRKVNVPYVAQKKRRVSRAGPRRVLRQSADICGGEGWDLGPKCRPSASSVV